MRNRPNHTMELTVADVAFQFRWTARNLATVYPQRRGSMAPSR